MSTNDGGGPRQIVPADPHEGLTVEQLAREADRLVDLANRSIRKSDLEKETVADEFFRSVFMNKSGLVLGPTAYSTRLYLQLEAQAGHKLDLTDEELAQYVVIGALNQRLGRSRWPSLPWSRKVELLPLVQLEDGLRTLRRGVVLAARSSVSRDELHAFVLEHKPRELGSGGRPSGTTVRGVESYAEKGMKLLEEREQIRERIRAAPAKQRKALVRDLRALASGLADFVAEFDDDE